MPKHHPTDLKPVSPQRSSRPSPRRPCLQCPQCHPRVSNRSSIDPSARQPCLQGVQCHPGVPKHHPTDVKPVSPQRSSRSSPQRPYPQALSAIPACQTGHLSALWHGYPAYRPLRGRLPCAVKPIEPHRASEYALHPSGTAFGLLGVLLEGLSGNRHRFPHQEPSHNRSPAVLRLISNHVLAQCPIGLPMPPAAVCHLSAAGTPTTSWSSAFSGANASCDCLPPHRCLHSNRVLVQCPGASPEDYFPARCFSQAQAEARVSSIGRSAFQPSSFWARVGSAQMATTSPGRRGANL